MAVAFDAVGPSASGLQWTADPQTWTHVCGGSATALVVFVAVDNVPSIVFTVTYNSVAMTHVAQWVANGPGAGAGIIAAFSLLNPAKGSNLVSVTTSGVSPKHGGSISFTGAGAFGAAVTLPASAVGNITSGSIPVTSTTSGNMVVAGVTNGSDTTAFTAGTSRFSTTMSGSGAAEDCAAATLASSTGTTTVTWTQASDWYGAIAFEVQASGGGAVTGGKKTVVPQAIRRASLW